MTRDGEELLEAAISTEECATIAGDVGDQYRSESSARLEAAREGEDPAIQLLDDDDAMRTIAG
jgi:hypothetical protein